MPLIRAIALSIASLFGAATSMLPWSPSSSMVTIAPDCSWMPWMIFPPGPMTAPMNSFGITNVSRLVVFAWRRDCFVDDSEDVQTAFASLVEGFLKDFVGKSVALDIHLCCGDTVSCTGHLEVHVAEVVLVAENVGKNGIFRTVVVCDKTHCNTRNRLFHLHTGVEQRQCAGAYCCHRR